MKLKSKYLLRVGALAVITGLVGFAGCTNTKSGSRTSGQRQSDHDISKEVHTALGNDPTFKYSDVKANVYNGTVQLTGFVETPEQRIRAGELAAHTKGTWQVINSIMIKPTPTGGAIIRDPLSNNPSLFLVDTNSLPPRMYNLPASDYHSGRSPSSGQSPSTLPNTGTPSDTTPK
jgi:hypothetical protein